jgi:hypothetical protein
MIDGYPGDYTKEWATAGGGAGSWLKLTWSSPQTVTITFPAKTITSLQLNITSVSPSTQNIGLAEIEVYAS